MDTRRKYTIVACFKLRDLRPQSFSASLDRCQSIHPSVLFAGPVGPSGLGLPNDVFCRRPSELSRDDSHLTPPLRVDMAEYVIYRMIIIIGQRTP